MNLPATPKPPPYRFLRNAPAGPSLVLQVRDPETGERVDPCDLEGYRARVKISTPWHGLEKLPVGSRLLLTPTAARYMLAAGTIESLEEPPLILSRDTVRKPGG
jgi:hypothetical protein